MLQMQQFQNYYLSEIISNIQYQIKFVNLTILKLACVQNQLSQQSLQILIHHLQFNGIHSKFMQSFSSNRICITNENVMAFYKLQVYISYKLSSIYNQVNINTYFNFQPDKKNNRQQNQNSMTDFNRIQTAEFIRLPPLLLILNAFLMVTQIFKNKKNTKELFTSIQCQTTQIYFI
ncbi:unnamed protein product (macronuclear) [Paramecium tetraurelia]|uniref:Transmembrane protein n=1 Tax=Paramecium tetraurelia TaxID=5888 RepID=A0C5X6_PARTE|nr:uncharacterized protein GSPATT00035322001 [Paramecium tetraurelia]CAK66193.1 unnamed protein product [Paramecium tetraurelia]|eukprot:XP_001433590.1 hypothetical protein (macronuclear) [Paramecium tetraurelia strain d4-2]